MNSFAKKENELEIPIHTTGIFSQDIVKEFGIENDFDSKKGWRNNWRNKTVKSGKNLDTWRNKKNYK